MHLASPPRVWPSPSPSPTAAQYYDFHGLHTKLARDENLKAVPLPSKQLARANKDALNQRKDELDEMMQVQAAGVPGAGGCCAARVFDGVCCVCALRNCALRYGVTLALFIWDGVCNFEWLHACAQAIVGAAWLSDAAQKELQGFLEVHAHGVPANSLLWPASWYSW
jgi:hypothetical protein